jgi:hypothetical protein
MRGHGLMQVIARVNRVFQVKPGGFPIDYFGFADNLSRAISNYTECGSKGKATINQEVNGGMGDGLKYIIGPIEKLGSKKSGCCN